MFCRSLVDGRQLLPCDFFLFARHSTNMRFSELLLLPTRISCTGRSVTMACVGDELERLKCLPITIQQKDFCAGTILTRS